MLTCTELLLQHPLTCKYQSFSHHFIIFLHCLHAHYSLLRLKQNFFFFLSVFLFNNSFIFSFFFFNSVYPYSVIEDRRDEESQKCSFNWLAIYRLTCIHMHGKIHFNRYKYVSLGSSV